MTKFRFWIPLFLLTALWAPLATSLSAVSTTIVISEFRTRGPNGGNDEFIELHNLSNAPVDIGGWKIRGSSNSGVVGDRLTIAAGTTLGPGCFFLATNSSASGGPYSGSVPGNQSYGTGIADDGGLAITLPNDTIVDAVGMSNGSAFKEGTTLASTTTNVDRGIERKPGGAAGHNIDSDNNANDFLAIVPGTPQNLGSPCIEYGDGASISIGDVAVTEGDSGQTVATFTVTASGDHTGITFDITAVDGTGANAATAADNDFAAAPGVGSIAAGETTFTYNVAVNGDVTFEPTETYSVVISNPNGAAVAKGAGIGTIVNDDPAPPVESEVVISQVYGGGGNSGATLTNDFIELFNRGTSAIDLTGWSVQFVSRDGLRHVGSDAAVRHHRAGTYYLVRQAAGAGGTTPLPTPDASGTIAMGATSGKVALRKRRRPISGRARRRRHRRSRGLWRYATASRPPPTIRRRAIPRRRCASAAAVSTPTTTTSTFRSRRRRRETSSTPATSCSATARPIHEIQGNGWSRRMRGSSSPPPAS